MDYNLIKWPTMSEYPYPSIFRAIDGHPMVFYFHLDDIDVKKKFENLVRTYGGDIVEKYVDMTPYTAFMVDDKCVRNFYNRVSFKASYIIKCITDGILLNINSFIHNNVVKFRENDYMKVIYSREAVFTADKLDVASCSSSDTVSKPVINQKVTAYRIESANTDSNKDRNCRRKSPNPQCSYAESSKSKINHNGKNEVSKTTSKETSNGKQSDESAKICLNPCAHCSLNKVNHSDNIVDLSSTNERNPTKPLDFSKNQAHCSSSSGDKQSSKRPVVNSRECSRSPLGKSKPRVEAIEQDSSDSETVRNTVINRRRPNPFDSDSSQSSEEVSPRNNRPMNNVRNRRRLSEDDDDDDDDFGPSLSQSHFSNKVDNKHSRNLYTRQEKEAILQYIVKKEAYESVKGVKLWKKMENSNICPRRTWMSLQNHFKKTLLKELELYPFLTKYQINLLRG